MGLIYDPYAPVARGLGPRPLDANPRGSRQVVRDTNVRHRNPDGAALTASARI